MSGARKDPGEGLEETRVCYFDCASGASGDMILGALVDMGLPIDSLRDELRKVPLGGYRLEARKVDRSGILATKVDVLMDGPPEGKAHGHSHGGAHGHSHRGLREILDLLARSTLAPEILDRCSKQFRRLAEAEAATHGVSPEAVEFHEVGAVDSIVDIVGANCGLSWLKAGRFVSSPLNVGGGTVSMSHGTYQVPPPATLALVKGVPVRSQGDFELLTPTGALLVTSYASSYGELPAMIVEAAGYGAGTRDTKGSPNVLRLVVGRARAIEGASPVVVLEAEMDDLSPQLAGPLVERLLSAGALDAFLTPIQMKKSRPGILITVLAEPVRRADLEELLFSETTTLGIRRASWERTTLERESVAVDSPYGRVRVKVGRRGDRVYNAQPEFEDCQKLAESCGVPIKEVWIAALTAFRTRQG